MNGHIKRNNLINKHQVITSMKGIQGNKLLNGPCNSPCNSPCRQPKRIDDRKLKEAILDQREHDQKIDSRKFNKLVDTITTSFEPERAKLWEHRTNQPYKTILPANDIKKEYKTKEELIVHKVNKNEKDTELFIKNKEILEKSRNNHNNELKQLFPNLSENDIKIKYSDFKNKNDARYLGKYDPEDYKEMKENIINFFKDEQLKQETDKKNIDNIIDACITNELSMEKQEHPEKQEMNKQESEQNESEKVEKIEQTNNIDINKYLQRQKKI